MKEKTYNAFVSKLKNIYSKKSQHKQLVSLLDVNVDYIDLLEPEIVSRILSYGTNNNSIFNFDMCQLILEAKSSQNLENKQKLLDTMSNWAFDKFRETLAQYQNQKSSSLNIYRFLCKNYKTINETLDLNDLKVLLSYVDNNQISLLSVIIQDNHIARYKGEFNLLSILCNKGLFYETKDENGATIYNTFRQYLILNIEDIATTKYAHVKSPLVEYMFYNNLIPAGTKFSIGFYDLLESKPKFFRELSESFHIENSIEYYENFYSDLCAGRLSYGIEFLYDNFRLKFTGSISHIKFIDSEVYYENQDEDMEYYGVNKVTWNQIFDKNKFVELCKFANAMVMSNPINIPDVLYTILQIIENNKFQSYLDYQALQKLIDNISTIQEHIAEHDIDSFKFISSFANAGLDQFQSDMVDIVGEIVFKD